jgi:protease I
MNKLSGKKIIMVIAPRMFRDEEFKIPFDAFKNEGAKVIIACSSLNTSVGKLGLKVKPDIQLNKINVDDADAVLFVGGPGVKEYWEHATAQKIAKDFLASGKLLTAICSAPVILAKAGLLRGKKATAFDGDEMEMLKCGCIYTGKSVEQDGKIITGNGPAAAKQFVDAIIKELTV